MHNYTSMYTVIIIIIIIIQNGPMEGCGDGEWRGHRYFTCVYKRSFFCPLASLLPDTRTPQSSHPAQAGATPPGNRESFMISDYNRVTQLIFHVHNGCNGL